MSSSEFLRRPEWVDLRETTPPARVADFHEQSEFEKVQTGPPRDVNPDEAHRMGLAEGEARGREAAAKELEPVIEAFGQLTLSIGQLRRAQLAELEGELVETATEIARRILRGELQQDGDTVLRMARACLDEVAEKGPMILHVAPADAELVRTHVPELGVDLAESALTVAPNPNIGPGCVVLQTPTGAFDGRPERVLEANLTDPATEEVPS